jgi:type IV secretory pathway VirB10-like protein
MAEIPQIQEKAPRPAGLLPKNVQAWVLVALAFLMVAIMWLTGGKKPQAPSKTLSAAAPAQVPLEVNETKIAELQNRIEELQRQQLVAQNALAQQSRLFGTATEDSQQAPPQENGVTAPPEQKAEDPIVVERKRRAYVSLFSSNVALSYRTPLPHAASIAETPQAPSDSTRPETDSAQIAQLLKGVEQNSAPSPPSTQSDSVETTTDRKEETKSPAANQATGKTYVLFEGTILETVLINRLDGQFSGPVECLLSTDVYSRDRQHLLIPAGSKILGETRKVDTFGQTRLAVVFHRVVMPDGYSVSLDQFKGLNQIGDTGLRDQVNNHYFRIFGVSLAIGALGAIAEGGANGSLNASGADLMRQGFAESTAQSSAQILDKFLNVMPTVTIREGHRVKVYLSGDLTLPDYNNHTMPSDL